MAVWRFFFFPIGGPLRLLSLCLLCDERLMECCSARPEPTLCVRKVTESALVYSITRIIHRYYL